MSRRHPSTTAALALVVPWLCVACARATDVVGNARIDVDAGPTADHDAAFVFIPGDGDALVAPNACEPDRPAPWLPAPAWNCGDGCFRAPALPVEATLAFAGPVDGNTDQRPRFAYPLPDSVHPVNIADMTLHWARGRGGTQRLFRVEISGQSSWRLFVPCDRPLSGTTVPAQEHCVYTLPDWVWLNIAAENRGRDIALQIAATTAAGDPVATSEPIRIRFSPGSVEGGFYYWSSVDGPSFGTIFRMVFGGRKASKFIAPFSDSNPTQCGGCHTVSRDGTLLAFTADEARGRLYLGRSEDPDNPIVSPEAPDPVSVSMSSLSPDGALLLVSYGDRASNGRLAVLRTRDGTRVATLDPAVLGPGSGKLFFPEWSPSSSRREIVAVRARNDVTPWSVLDGSIVVIRYDDGRFGPAQVLVAETQDEFHYYPTFSPDGAWVAFVTARKVPNRSSYDNADSRLRLVRRSDGRIFDLQRATQSLGKTSSWPKFAPFQQANCQLMFLTFNSKMDYGFIRPNGTTALGGWPQLWMTAIDLRQLEGGDPSSAPIWLPFQADGTHNHLGFWTTSLRCRPGAPAGSVESCGDGEVCDPGEGRCHLAVP